MTHSAGPGGWEQLHLLITIGIVVTLLMVPFSSLRKLPMPRCTRVYGLLYFATCAVTHVAGAAGFAGSRWLLVNDAVQLVALAGFFMHLNRECEWALRRRRERDRPPGPEGKRCP